MQKHEPELNGVAISDTSIRQPVFITMIMLLIVTMGLLSYSSLPVNLYPDFSIPIVAVQVIYPGASPDSVAEQVSEPVEDALISLSGVKHITSESYEGANMITVEFATDVDVDVAEQDVRSKVNAILPQLPADVEDPLFFKFDPQEIPVISMAVFSQGERTPVELRKVIEDDIIPQLQRIQGVGSVTINGGQQRQINVLLDLEKLQARQILPSMVTQAVQRANINRGLGSINTGELDIALRAPSMFQEPQDIASARITGTPYRIGDVATIEDGIADVESYARLDGKDAVSIQIIKRSDANVVAVADNVKEELAVIFPQYPDLEYFIPNDSSVFVEESTHSAIEELLVASLAAMMVVFLFFRNVRNTLVTLIGLPIIMIGTFIAISLFGLTINVVTLLGLSLSVGLVIDDAIVVRENIFRHAEMGQLPMIAASRGTAEVSLAVLAMTLTVIAVFVPVTFTSGIAGIIFKSFGLVVASAMALSLFEAFTLAPMTSARLFKEDKKHVAKRKEREAKKQQQAENGEYEEIDEQSEIASELEEDVGWMGRGYARLLSWSLGNRLVIVGITLAILVLSVYVASGLKMAFFPESDQGTFYVGFELPPGSPLEKTNELALRAEQLIMQDPQVEAVLTTVGGGGGGGGGTDERGEIFVKLHEEHEPTQQVIERMRPQLDFLPTLAFGKEAGGPGGNSSQVTGRDVQLQINTTRPLEELIPFLQELKGQASQVEGLVDIDTTYKPGKPELQIFVDPSKIGDIGITNDDLASSVRTLVNGTKADVFRKNGEDVDIVVRLQPGDRASLEDIANINVPTLNGSRPIGSLVDVQFDAGPTTIRRYDRANQIIIGANVVGRNTNDVIQEIRVALSGFEAPPGVEFGFGGDAEEQAEGFQTLLIAMGLSILFVYMVLASQFASFLQPFVIMLAMPFSFLGSFLALRIVGMELDIISMIGLIMLMGLVVKNSILLIDFTNRLRRAGFDKHAALEKAGAVRLRPILMTSLSIIAGAMPVAIGLGEGSEIRQGLSVVLIGGMITSTLLTLLVVPTAYSLLVGTVDRFNRFINRRTGQGKVDEQPSAPAAATASQHTSQQTISSSSSQQAGSGDGATVSYSTTHEMSSEHGTNKGQRGGE
jgi:HAE1 family hydrophobic/amphiphilic exporter-1